MRPTWRFEFCNPIQCAHGAIIHYITLQYNSLFMYVADNTLHFALQYSSQRYITLQHYHNNTWYYRSLTMKNQFSLKPKPTLLSLYFLTIMTCRPSRSRNYNAVELAPCGELPPVRLPESCLFVKNRF